MSQASSSYQRFLTVSSSLRAKSTQVAPLCSEQGTETSFQDLFDSKFAEFDHILLDQLEAVFRKRYERLLEPSPLVQESPLNFTTSSPVDSSGRIRQPLPEKPPPSHGSFHVANSDPVDSPSALSPASSATTFLLTSRLISVDDRPMKPNASASLQRNN